ncbi:MAG: MYXO-CTERM sorting domain-containing protein [Nannocystaceae bacterium]
MRRAPYFALALLIPLLSPRLAEACSGCPGTPYFSGVSWPEDGGTLASNAPIFLSGVDLSLAGVQVTVDGAAATLVEVPEFGFDGECVDVTAYRVSPEPAEGALVAISGEVCDPALNDTCDDLSLTFTATAADHEAPSPASALRFDIYVPHSEWTCAPIANTVWYFDITADYDEPQQARARWKIEALPAPDAAPSATFLPLRVAEPLYTTLNTLTSPGASPCFRVTAIDEAGNASAPMTLCEPCHYKVDPIDGTPWYELPPEPMWQDDERVYGGPCDDGTVPNPDEEAPADGATAGESGDDSGPEGGCACAVETGRGAAGLLGLVGLVGLGLRRRRR